jgi:hypothetical protein
MMAIGAQIEETRICTILKIKSHDLFALEKHLIKEPFIPDSTHENNLESATLTTRVSHGERKFSAFKENEKTG